MKKIVLNLNALRVESFETTGRAVERRGTVHAAGASEDTGCESEGLTYCGSCGPTDCLDPSCGPPCEPTFPYSCWGTCIGETCDAWCPPMSSVETCLSCQDC
jgi:hypothetical protein